MVKASVFEADSVGSIPTASANHGGYSLMVRRKIVDLLIRVRFSVSTFTEGLFNELTKRSGKVMGQGDHQWCDSDFTEFINLR